MKYVTRTGVEVEIGGEGGLQFADGYVETVSTRLFHRLFQPVEETRTCATCRFWATCADAPDGEVCGQWTRILTDCPSLQPREEPTPDPVAELRECVAKLEERVEDHLGHHAGTKMEVRDE